ncbi:ABC transporter permease [Asanoa iriomotensis]|uniref:Transport permease protein n=1 Tax=Asanoa iriomotensis TaxID=234613 RepID=A0ABQ4CDZ2_9ACTN|nr:ABC transporter permease [Asanoa iriomotensis]GIF60997.1 transport permease protein [Asanoa iriomotensis]
MTVVSLGAARAGIELRQFWRERDAVVFTFALPIVLLTLLGSLFSGVYEGSTVTSAQYLVPSMIAAGVASTTFVNLGIGIATDRDDGTLKRLRGLPMPPLAYLIGKVLLVVAVTVLEVVLIVGIGIVLFDLSLPSSPARWLTFAWVFGLGVVACGLLGVAAGALPRTARSAAAVLNLPYVVLGFISGIYYTPVGALPDWVIQLGSVFPLKWMAQGFRSAFLPDSILPQEVVPSWEHGRTALVLAAWCIGGLVLCLTTFRWSRRG